MLEICRHAVTKRFQIALLLQSSKKHNIFKFSEPLTSMKIELLDTRELIPLEPPHRPEVVESLRKAYAKEDIDRIPPSLVRRIKGKGVYVADGHHKAGVAHLFGAPAMCIFLNSHNDISDLFAIADMGIYQNFTIASQVVKDFRALARVLPAAHEEYAAPWGIHTFDDWANWVKEGKYLDLKRFNPITRHHATYHVDITRQYWPQLSPQSL